MVRESQVAWVPDEFRGIAFLLGVWYDLFRWRLIRKSITVFSSIVPNGTNILETTLEWRLHLQMYPPLRSVH